MWKTGFRLLFLDGKAVDNLGEAMVRDGSILALSAAMPGVWLGPLCAEEALLPLCEGRLLFGRWRDDSSKRRSDCLKAFQPPGAGIGAPLIG